MEIQVDRTVWNRAVFAMLCSLVVLTVIPYGTVHPPVIAVFYLLAVLSFIVASIDGLVAGRIRVSLSVLQLPFILTVIYAVIQVIPFGSAAESAGLPAGSGTISKDPFWTMVFAAHLLVLGGLFSLTLSSLDSFRRIRRLSDLITVFGFLLAFFAIIQSFLSPTKIYGIYEVATANPFGPFVNRHNFAAYMEMAIAMPLGLLLSGAVRRDKRLLYATTAVLMAVALLMSGSRGGLVALAAQTVLLLIFARGRLMSGRVWLKFGLAAVLLGVIVGGAAYIGSETSMSRLSETAASEDFSTKRTQIWKVTMDVIRNSLPFGTGFGAFGVAYTEFDPQNGLERVEQAHNDYLQIVSDAGVVGIGIGAVFLFGLIRSARKVLKLENLHRRGVGLGALAGIFGILVHSLFDFVLHTTAISVLFVTLLALLAATQEGYADDETEARRTPSQGSSGNIARIDGMKKGG